MRPTACRKNRPSVSQNSFPTVVCLFITTLDDQQKKMNMDHISCRQRNTVEKKNVSSFYFLSVQNLTSIFVLAKHLLGSVKS